MNKWHDQLEKIQLLPDQQIAQMIGKSGQM